jgi:ABC-type sulfate/molybdate transport systems ATPase subunit
VGESGAVKTTALRLLAGLERFQRGRLVVDGVTWSGRLAKNRYDTARAV